MRRREFAKAIVGSLVAWPFAAHAQVRKLPTIGFLGATTAAAARDWSASFVQRLREIGWIEGQTVTIEYRWADGREARFEEIATEFVRLKVDLIVTYGTPSAAAAKKVTTAVPIVFAAAGDPVGTGLVASLARPGGNITGLSIQQTDLAGKRLEILREAFPGLRTLGIVANSGSASAVIEMRETEAAASKYGLDVVKSEIRSLDDLEAAIEAFKGRAEALYFCPDPLLTTNRRRVVTLALGARLPAMFGFREYVEAGGLMSYGPNFPDLFRRAAEYVDKILRGVKPSDLPVEQPTKFDLVINSTTAKALGLKISEANLLRANEVIE
jgi:putative ABC transport system substrate-binding protein